MNHINNSAARDIILTANGLTDAPTAIPDVHALITQLGLLQLDTINNVVRAHHHILWSRSRSYRPNMLDIAYRNDDNLFEHFTHDASILPMATYPFWHRRMQQMARKPWYKTNLHVSEYEAIIARIADEGALSIRAFDSKKTSNEMWARSPHKKALDFLWLSGRLAIAHRVNFEKFYDLTENVIPAKVREIVLEDAQQVDWLCTQAQQKLGLAFTGDISRFWAAVSPKEVAEWAKQNAQHSEIVSTECALGQHIKATLSRGILPRDTSYASQMRLINPFDPLVRDRKRLERIFGFVYRNEMFVPKAKRQYGYYVYPLLQGDTFVGRLELKADQRESILNVTGFWPEPGVRWGKGRMAKLDAELARFARFAGLSRTIWKCR